MRTPTHPAAANTGCNYDPADPRGKEEVEGIKVIRRRAWLVMAAEFKAWRSLSLHVLAIAP